MISYVVGSTILYSFHIHPEPGHNPISVHMNVYSITVSAEHHYFKTSTKIARLQQHTTFNRRCRHYWLLPMCLSNLDCYHNTCQLEHDLFFQQCQLQFVLWPQHFQLLEEFLQSQFGSDTARNQQLLKLNALLHR